MFDSDSDSDSSQKCNDSGIDSDSGIGIVHHCIMHYEYYYRPAVIGRNQRLVFEIFEVNNAETRGIIRGRILWMCKTRFFFLRPVGAWLSTHCTLSYQTSIQCGIHLKSGSGNLRIKMTYSTNFGQFFGMVQKIYQSCVSAFLTFAPFCTLLQKFSVPPMVPM